MTLERHLMLLKAKISNFISLPLLMGAILVLPVPGWGQQAGPKPAPPLNRYLLIVETSRSMQKRLDGTLKSVQNLLVGGFGGQLQRYDTIGLWTFDQQLHSGAFPLQTWSQESHLGIVKHILTFLQGQKYGKIGNLTNVVPTMNKVIQGSDFIMVILISSGEQSIQGTPFDGPINDYYRLWQADQAKAHMPFVTVLRAKKGKIFDYVVSPAPWPVEIPPLPAELRPEATNQLAAAKKAPHTLPPLIVSGHKSEPAAAAPAQTPAQQESGVSVTSTNFVGMVVQTTPTVPPQTLQTPAVVASPEPAPVAVAPASKPVAEAGANPANSAAVPPAVVSEQKSEQPPPAQESAPEKKAPTQPAHASAPEMATSPPTSQATATPPARSLFGNKVLWAIGLMLAGVAGFGLYLVSKRKRPTEHASLITRSFEKDR